MDNIELHDFGEKIKHNLPESKWEKFKDKVFDLTPWWILKFYDSCLRLRTWDRRIRFFWQRHTRGFDDSETWDLDYTFVQWLLPRLKRFSEVVCCYPGTKEYPTFESWETELKHRVEQLELIVEYFFTEYDFPDISWTTLDNPNKGAVSMDAFDKCYEDFMKWFVEWHRHLWW